MEVFCGIFWSARFVLVYFLFECFCENVPCMWLGDELQGLESIS